MFGLNWLNTYLCAMKIVEIFEPYIYSIQFDGCETDEYHRLLNEWSDIEFVKGFFERNKAEMSDYLLSNVGNIYNAIEQVLDEAYELGDTFESLYENTKNGDKPDFDTHFSYLDGVYRFEFTYTPMKSYGHKSPSLIRMYAIKVDKNVFVISDGGIKLAKRIQDAPELKDHVFNKINIVREYLRNNNITTSDDIKNI